MKKTILFIISVCSFNMLVAQKAEWGLTLGSAFAPTTQFYANAVAADGAGNSYVTGSNNSTKVYISKYSTASSSAWSVLSTGTGTGNGRDLKVDVSGNVYAVGDYTGSFTLGTTTLTGTASFIVKINSAGTVQWLKKINGTVLSIALNSIGLPFVCGYFSGSAIFGSFTLVSGGSDDILVLRYTTAGAINQAHNYGGIGTERALNIAVDVTGKVAFAGSYTTAFSIGTYGVSGNTAFLASTNATFGTVNWAQSIHSSREMEADNAGFIYVLAAGDSVVKYNSSGIRQYKKKLIADVAFNPGGSIYDPHIYTLGTDINGNVYAAGRIVEYPSGNSGAVIERLSSSAVLTWWTQTSSTPSGNGGMHIAADPNGNAYVIIHYQDGVQPYHETLSKFRSSPIGINGIRNYDICAAKFKTVSYSTNGITFNAGNHFIAQYKDGSTWIPIGSSKSNKAGTINVDLPAGEIQVNNYYFRVISTDPPINGDSLSYHVGGAYPAVTIAGSTTICEGDSVLLYTDNTASKWYTPLSFAGNDSVHAKDAGDYTSEVLLPLGNADCDLFSKTISIIVIPKPNATIVAGGPTTFCAGGSVVLSTANDPEILYQWKKDNVSILGAVNSSYTATLAGVYKLYITNTNNCSRTTNSITVSIPCREASAGITGTDVKLLSEPLSQDITLKYDLETSAIVSASILDESGNELMKFAPVNRFAGANSDVHQTGSLAAGIYFCKVTIGTETSYLKFIRLK